MKVIELTTIKGETISINLFKIESVLNSRKKVVLKNGSYYLTEQSFLRLMDCLKSSYFSYQASKCLTREEHAAQVENSLYSEDIKKLALQQQDKLLVTNNG